MTQDYRYTAPEQVPEPTSADAKAIIHAIKTGWVGRGFAMALGFFLFGVLFWLVFFVLLRSTLEGMMG